MEFTEDDFLGDIFEAQGEVKEKTLAEIVRLANDMSAEERILEELEAKVKEQKAKVHKMKEVLLPEALASVGLPDGGIALDKERFLRVEDYVSGSLPKDPAKRRSVLDALIDAGGEDLIRGSIVIPFDKGATELATAIISTVLSSHPGVECSLNEDVHHSTLAAFVREKLKSGEDIDPSELGCYASRRAKIAKR